MSDFIKKRVKIVYFLHIFAYFCCFLFDLVI